MTKSRFDEYQFNLLQLACIHESVDIVEMLYSTFKEDESVL